MFVNRSTQHLCSEGDSGSKVRVRLVESNLQEEPFAANRYGERSRNSIAVNLDEVEAEPVPLCRFSSEAAVELVSIWLTEYRRPVSALPP